MIENPRLWIGGEWLETRTQMDVVNPATGEIIARAPLGDIQTLEAALAAAREAFPRVRDQPAHQRSAVLQAIAHGLAQRRAEFVDTIVSEAGKPIVLAEGEVARAIATGGFAYAGQSCISVQRVFVHEPIYRAFREAFINHVRDHVRCGDPRLRDTVVGPLIDLAAVDRICRWIQDARKAGATVLLGGEAQGRVVGPTILENADPHLDICAREVFGPVVTLHRYEQFDEGLARLNDSAFGLQAGVFTQNMRRAMQAFASLDVGGVLINNVPTFRVENMPYGGIKDSGFGREGIRCAMKEMTEVKSLIFRL